MYSHVIAFIVSGISAWFQEWGMIRSATAYGRIPFGICKWAFPEIIIPW